MGRRKILHTELRKIGQIGFACLQRFHLSLSFLRHIFEPVPAREARILPSYPKKPIMTNAILHFCSAIHQKHAPICTANCPQLQCTNSIQR